MGVLPARPRWGVSRQINCAALPSNDRGMSKYVPGTAGRKSTPRLPVRSGPPCCGPTHRVAADGIDIGETLLGPDPAEYRPPGRPLGGTGAHVFRRLRGHDRAGARASAPQSRRLVSPGSNGCSDIGWTNSPRRRIGVVDRMRGSGPLPLERGRTLPSETNAPHRLAGSSSPATTDPDRCSHAGGR